MATDYIPVQARLESLRAQAQADRENARLYRSVGLHWLAAQSERLASRTDSLIANLQTVSAS